MPLDPSDPAAISYAATSLLCEYQALVDAKDIDGLAQIVHPDVELTRRGGTSHGSEAFLDLYRRFAASDVRDAQHMATNVMATTNDDDTVDVRSTFIAITTHEAGGARQIWGRYHDTMAWHGGRWVLTAKRIAVVRTALFDETMLAPVDIDTFAVIPR
ncbi:nuclear transport factor 2 family protein [Gordonia sp. HY442]|uniref:nuclear transport factor 2 family protein n=1 Tax=Gordonia zhenghanii TaxID=2911516 RepID=UPI001F2FB988|nr:nuclear transport factor 2 family protein [Gordonia zhenghanii]MCF8608170.1 nuclear transport factor 2 family protein [Gordonia zhenghanii]